LARLGATAIPINIHWKNRELELALQDLQVTAIITNLERLSQWERTHLPSHPSKLSIEEILGNALNEGPGKELKFPPEPAEHEDALYLLTSGSTSRPKVVMRTAESLLVAPTPRIAVETT